MQKTKLQEYFPMLKSREEVQRIIDENDRLARIFYSWRSKHRTEFLDFCSGARGGKMLYDSFAKELLNPELYPDRLGEILSILLETEVTIIDVQPNEGKRIAAENSLLTMDIVVKLKDGSIANVEIQKIGYAFPGQRCACYSSDLLLRQYKSVRAATEDEKFSYRDIQNVYTIVFIEKSTGEFWQYPDDYQHRFEQTSDTGLKLELLQKYIFIPLDIYLKKRENKDIGSRLDAWLVFLGSDDPEDIVRVIETYPDFRAMYTQIYGMCQNMENMMGMFSKELEILDRNTVKYMIDEMEDAIKQKDEIIKHQQEQLAQQEEVIAYQGEQISQQQGRIEEQQGQIEQQRGQIEQQQGQLKEQKDQILAILARLTQLEEKN
ncbi:MAG: PD-(D/E)XK nuclease family transposase [Lachnospiraceae bacterium]|nr:PD-(D/E)XK nuclease family transposase [Lachnospiraceae bacterium]